MGKQSITILLGLIFTAQLSVQAQVVVPKFTVQIDNTGVALPAVAGQPLKQAETDADLIERIEILQKIHPNISLKDILLSVSLTALSFTASEGWLKVLLRNHTDTRDRFRIQLEQLEKHHGHLDAYQKAHLLHLELEERILEVEKEKRILHDNYTSDPSEANDTKITQKIDEYLKLVDEKNQVWELKTGKAQQGLQVSLIRINEMSEHFQRSPNPLERSLGQKLSTLFEGLTEYSEREISKAGRSLDMSEMNKVIVELESEIKSYGKSITQIKNMRMAGRATGLLAAVTTLYFIFKEPWSSDPTYGGQGVFGRKLSEATPEEINDLIKTIKESGLTTPQLGDAISSIAGKL